MTFSLSELAPAFLCLPFADIAIGTARDDRWCARGHVGGTAGAGKGAADSISPRKFDAEASISSSCSVFISRAATCYIGRRWQWWEGWLR